MSTLGGVLLALPLLTVSWDAHAGTSVTVYRLISSEVDNSRITKNMRILCVKCAKLAVPFSRQFG